MNIQKRISASEISADYKAENKKILTVSLIILAAVLAASYFSVLSFKERLINDLSLDHAKQLSTALEEVRTVYTRDVVSRSKTMGVAISHDFDLRDDAIPLPATFSMMIGEAISNKELSGSVNLYSDYPFPWRENQLDTFQLEALEAFRQHAAPEYSAKEVLNDKLNFRYAVPDVMREACIDCHNNHPDSTKTDWQVGDVRGVLEVIIPIDKIHKEVDGIIGNLWLLVMAIIVLVLLAFGFFYRRVITQTDEIIHQTRNLESEISLRVEVEEQKNAADKLAAELQDKEAKMRSIVETAAEGIVTIISEEGIITTFNSAAENIFGRQSAEIVGQNVNLLTPEDISVDAFLKQHQDSQRERSSYETFGIKSDGNKFPIQISISHLTINNESAYTIIVRDLTETKLLESQLLQSQKLESVGQLAAGIAHEINTPMQFIGDNIQFLKTASTEILDFLNDYRSINTSTDNNLRASLESIDSKNSHVDIEFLNEEMGLAFEDSVHGVSRVSKIISAMKDFSHPGGDVLEFEDINKAIESTTIITQNEWKYVATLNLELDKSIGKIPCLIHEFSQVILNMVINASHAIQQRFPGGEIQGIITIKSYLKDDEVHIEVTDNGDGIAEENLNKVFDQFFTTKEVGIGTGQGLSIAYQTIVEKHKGRLDLKSEQGVGTTFYIVLPAEEANQ